MSSDYLDRAFEEKADNPTAKMFEEFKAHRRAKPIALRKRVESAPPSKEIAKFSVFGDESGHERTGRDHSQPLRSCALKRLTGEFCTDSAAIKSGRHLGMGEYDTSRRSQMEGAVTMALTTMNYSEVTYKNGAAQQSNFPDYEMVRMDTRPARDPHLSGWR